MVRIFDEFVAFKEKLQASNIPIVVQALDWGRIPESFRKNILGRYTSIKK